MDSEIQKKMNFDILRYSMVWEDIDMLYQGLNIHPEDSILSITSAGDNVLNMLLKEPRSITAIDLNATQNALLELKIEAIRHLEWNEFTGLLGVTPNTHRVTMYESIRKHLSVVAKRFWDDQNVMIENGIIDQGRLEKYFEAFYRDILPGLHSGDVLNRLLDLKDIFEQESFYEKIWGTSEFVEAFRKYFGRENMAEHGRDAAQFEYVAMDSGKYFAERFKYVCTQISIQDNFYLQRFLSGSYGPNLPPYLREENYLRLRSLLPRIHVVTDSIEAYLRSGDRIFTKANLSDMFEYMSESNMADLLDRMHGSFKLGSRLAYWCLLVSRPLPVSLNQKFQSHDNLSKALWKQDRSWFYSDFHLLQRL